jgi:hypothetical protein
MSVAKGLLILGASELISYYLSLKTSNDILPGKITPINIQWKGKKNSKNGMGNGVSKYGHYFTVTK